MARPVPGTVVVLFILFFILLNPSAPPVSIARIYQIRKAIAEERASLDVLRNTSYGNFNPSNSSGWLNITGYREDDGYKWDLLPRAQERARTQLEKAGGIEGLAILNGTSNSSMLLYQNISGWMTGSWVRSNIGEDLSMPRTNLSAIAPSMAYLSSTYARNITGTEGKVQLRMSEPQFVDGALQDDQMRIVGGRLTLQDETSFADGWTMSLHGVHHPASGSLLLTTTSEKFAGIFGLPHLALSARYAELTIAPLNQSITTTIDEQEQDPDGASENPWESTATDMEFSTSPLCEIIVYLQQQPIRSFPSTGSDMPVKESLRMLMGLEHELRFPTGYAAQTPNLAMSMLVFSPDCGFILESKGPPDYVPQDGVHLQGPKIELYIGHAKRMMILFGFVIASQLLLLVQQMKETTTPSTRSRVSFYTLAIMSLGTGFVAFAFLFVSSLVSSVFLTSMTLAFLAFLDGSFFGMKFLMDVWTAQEPERSERERRRQQQRLALLTPATSAAAAAPSSTIHAVIPPTPASAAPTDSLPLPVTAAHSTDTGATPIPIPISLPNTLQPTTTTTTAPASPPLRPQTFSSIYTRHYLLLLAILLLSIHASTSWPLALRTLYTNTLSTLYLSLWLPQIHRNILRNSRHALSLRFILGQSALRLVPFAYLWCVDQNVLFVQTDRLAFAALAAWVWLQVLVLAGQEVLGARWCVSERWAWVPRAWDYHPILREDEEGATLPVGSSAADGEGEAVGNGKRSFDCAICMQGIEAPIVGVGSEGAGLGGTALWVARRGYMVTPCRHIFHTGCLESWIGYRLQCPICRETLPPL